MKQLTLIHICGVRADPGKLYQVLLQPFLGTPEPTVYPIVHNMEPLS